MTKPKYTTKEELIELRTDLMGLSYDTYFLCQYGIRKFLTDENVLFDENMPEEHKNVIKNIYGRDKITYRDVIDSYNSIKSFIFMLIAPIEKLISFDLINDSVLDKIVLPGIEMINKLQKFIVFYNDEVFKNDKHLFISDIKVPDNWKLSENDIEICKTLLKNKEFKEKMLLLNYISMRYGVMITSLCLQNFQIKNCNEELSFEELNHYRPFFSYKEHKKSRKEKKIQQNTLNDYIFSSERIDRLAKEKISSENSIITRDLIPHHERISDFFISMAQGNPIKKSSYKAIKNEAKSIYSLSRSYRSLRRAGLLVWDILHNPDPIFENIRKENSITNPTEASNYILSKGLYTNSSFEASQMMVKRYNNAVKCIKELTIIPIE